MIVWLASYPRSGNTLLRTVLYQTLGCGSCSDEIDPDVSESIAMSEAAAREYGRRELSEPWETFYPRASAAAETHFVKTHRSPRDAQPAIYVVRDGRAALASYEKFHRRFQPERARSLLELVLGADYYGDWSGHYARWTGRDDARVLVVKYEELIDASPALVERIARFLGRGDPAPWKNPFERLNRENPRFFASGKAQWEGEASWTPFVDAAFFELHGGLMAQLGYASAAETASARERLAPAERELVRLAASLAARNESLQEVCREREAVIQELNRACEERLALIRQFSVRQ